MLPAPAAPLPDLDPGLPAVLEPAHVRPAPAPAAKKQPAKQLKGQASMWQFTRVLQTRQEIDAQNGRLALSALESQEAAEIRKGLQQEARAGRWSKDVADKAAANAALGRTGKPGRPRKQEFQVLAAHLGTAAKFGLRPVPRLACATAKFGSRPVPRLACA